MSEYSDGEGYGDEGQSSEGYGDEGQSSGYGDEGQSSGGGDQQNEDSDVEIGVEFETGISIFISVDDLLADGYEVEPGDDTAIA